jgi:hypothetical protein
MLLQHNIKKTSEIRNAFHDMLAEEMSPEQTKNVTIALNKFVKKNPTAFETPQDLGNAKRLIRVIQRAKDEITIINLIADFSNLIIDSEDYSKELEEILGFVS